MFKFRPSYVVFVLFVLFVLFYYIFFCGGGGGFFFYSLFSLSLFSLYSYCWPFSWASRGSVSHILIFYLMFSKLLIYNDTELH